MLRIVLGVIVGIVAWVLVWVTGEMVLSIIWPEWYGAQQLAFQAAIEDGAEFTPDDGFLITQIVSASIVSLISGFLAALIAGENKRAPPRRSGVGPWLGQSRSVLAVCSHLVSRLLYGDSISHDGYRR